GEVTNGVDRDVFPFDRDDVEALGEAVEGGVVVVLGDDELGDVAGASVGDVVEDAAADIEGVASEGEHAAELAAAENADADHPAAGSGVSSTVWVWRARKSSSAALRLGRDRARIAVAKRAALTAPALPMAKVATGTPAGIWTIERRESRPL